MTTITQLTNIYLNKEWWVKEEDKLPISVANSYYDKLLNQGNILICEFKGQVLGYVEVWKINFEQFGRIVCHSKFCADGEDILNGNIGYVANVWIDEPYRRSWVTKDLILKFYKFTHDCEYFVGMATRKRTQPIKVFKKSELSSKLFKEGIYEYKSSINHN